MTVFKRNMQRYGRTPELETPYSRAGQVWDDRIGAARVQARNWRAMAFGSLLLATGLAAGLLWQTRQSRVVPYVVAVDQLGEARAVAPASATYQPTEAQIAWYLAHFIRDVRTVALDPVVMRQNWMEAYSFVTARGAAFLDQQARSSNPFADIGARTATVQVTSVVRVSDNSYQVKWTENAFVPGGAASVSHWTAIMTVVVKAPRSVEILRRNPLGLYVDGIDWSRNSMCRPVDKRRKRQRRRPRFCPHRAAIQQNMPRMMEGATNDTRLDPIDCLLVGFVRSSAVCAPSRATWWR